MAVLITPPVPFHTDSALPVASIYAVIEVSSFYKTQREIHLGMRFFASEAAAKPAPGVRPASPLMLVDVEQQLRIVDPALVSKLYTAVNEESFATMAYEQVTKFYQGIYGEDAVQAA